MSVEEFCVPAEWEPHAACIIGWPYRYDYWPERARPAQAAFQAVIRAISRSEKVILVVHPTQVTYCEMLMSEEVKEGMVEIWEVPYDDAWTRDIAPTYVVSSDRRELRGVDWTFNSWGGLHHSYELDVKFARALCERQDVVSCSTDLICEGGSLAFDGEGTLVTTESVLLSKSRNGPKMSKQAVEAVLLQMLGCQKLIWLPEGVYGDETCGHIDNLMAFVGPAEVVLCWTDDETDPQYAISRRAEEVLETSTDAKGRPFKIHYLHQPNPLVRVSVYARGVLKSQYIVEQKWCEKVRGSRIPASYVNFYIANKSVIVPQFNQPKWDVLARTLLEKLFPGREVIGVDARPIIMGGGAIHCITQQVPRTLTDQ